MIRKLLDGATLKFCGVGLIFRRSNARWVPRYDQNGDIYMWLKEPAEEGGKS